MDSKLIGRRIKIARENKKLTQEQLAELVDLSPMYVSVLERGKKPPKLQTLVCIANALDVSADYLLQDVVSKSSESLPPEFSDIICNLSAKDQQRALHMLKAFAETSL